MIRIKYLKKREKMRSLFIHHVGSLALSCALLFGFTNTTVAAPIVVFNIDIVAKTGKGSSILERREAWDLAHFAVSIQGIVNRKQPRLYLMRDGGQGDKFWLDYVTQQGEWLSTSSFITNATPESLLATFRSAIRGAVVWDPKVPATANIASTIAGVEDLAVVRYDPTANSLYDRIIIKGRLPVVRKLIRDDGGALFTGVGSIPGSSEASTGSAKCDAYLWAVINYLVPGKCAAGNLGYFPDSWWIRHPELDTTAARLAGQDYIIASRGFLFDLSPWADEKPNDDPNQPLGKDRETRLRVLQNASTVANYGLIAICGFTPWQEKYSTNTGGKHLPVYSEWKDVEQFTSFNAFLDNGIDANGSFFMHYPMATCYPQSNLPTLATLRAKKYLDSCNRPMANKTFVAFYMGDYGGGWLYSKLHKLLNAQEASSVPLSWSICPALAKVFPVGLVYARRMASPNATFVSGVCGAGYLNPGGLEYRVWSKLPSGVSLWADFNQKWNTLFDLRVTGFEIDGSSPAMGPASRMAYASFSPGGVVTQFANSQNLINGIPFLQMAHADLSTNAVQAVLNALTENKSKFAVFRAVLFSPKDIEKVAARIKQVRPDVEFVEMHSLMLLYKQSLVISP